MIAAASTEEKLAVCRERGATPRINYEPRTCAKRLKAITGGKGVDVVYDPVGGGYAEPALRSIAWEGRFLVVGFAAGEIPRIPLNLALLKGCQIVGVFWGSFVRSEPAANAAAMRQMIGWMREGRLRPLISARYSLVQVPEALKALESRSATGKVVVVPDLI